MPRLPLAVLLAVAAPVAAAPPPGIKAPPGFDVALFAAPPDVSYPTCLAATPDGDLFVGVDLNGSLGRKPGKGKIVRCTDTDGDGKADKFKTFVEVDSPRGLWWDGAKTLYVLHPPTITAYTDTDGDGKADKTDNVVTGLGFDLKFRGADHTTNGFRMAIDGFFYVAVGDYGAIKATGTDGRSIQLRGGGVVRVRPDGSGLEIVSRGQRNIYDVAVSPALDLFTRDNTNDGDGWDVRLTHVVPGAQYGYPSLYKHFPDDHLPPLADYGGGSPTGSIFLDEPGLPTGLFTCEWGRSAIYRHPLAPKGATFTAGQDKFLDVPRPTDIDVDGVGHLYVSTWKDGGFDFSKPDVGDVWRLTPSGHKPATFPDLAKATDDELMTHLGSPSGTVRLYVQREILRRGSKPAFNGVLLLANKSDEPLAARVAALFTYSQLKGAEAVDGLVRAGAQDANLREYALAALADDPSRFGKVSATPFLDGLNDKNPRVRIQAVIGLTRLGKKESAATVFSLCGDTDPVVAHLAVNAMASRADSVTACADAVVDAIREVYIVERSGGSRAGLDEAIKRAHAALRVLRLLHSSAAVDKLVAMQKDAKPPELRRDILVTLARLYTREAPWDGKWWGTRPDTTGPYYKPETWSESGKIADVFRAELKGDPETVKWLVPELVRHRVDLPEVAAVALKLAQSDPAFRPTAVAVFAGRPNPPAEAMPLFVAVAAGEKEPADIRAKAVRGLLAFPPSPASRDALVKALAGPKRAAGADKYWSEFARDGRHVADVPFFVGLAKTGTAGEQELAFGVLGSIAERNLGAKEPRAVADAAVRDGLGDAARLGAALAAVRRLSLDGYAPQVRKLADSPDKAVAKLAKATLDGIKLDAATAPPGQPVVSKMTYDDVLAIAVKDRGNAKLGEKLFARTGCVNCHTVSPTEPPKGPMLAGVTVKYTRPELVESVLRPSAKIAQGFETYTFLLLSGKSVTGFIARESGTDVEVRDAAGGVTVVKKDDIDERRPGKVSVMPDGLVDHLTPQEVASILAYLDTLKGK